MNQPGNLLPVREIFGPTIQGEGLHAGRLATFVRVAGCDSYCEWCDTKYAWDVNDTRVTRMTADQIAESIIRKVSLHKLVVLTGGNPCLYDLSELIDILHNNGYEVHVETQGTRFPDWLRKVDFVSLSPKMSSDPDLSFMAMAKAKSEVRNMIKSLDDIPHQLKFVIGDSTEYTFALEVAKSNPGEVVIFQPKHTDDTSGYVLANIAKLPDMICTDSRMPPNVRFMPQLHRIIWGDERGV